MLCRQADVALAKPKDASASAPKEWDAPTEKETVSAQQQHAKVNTARAYTILDMAYQ